MAADEAAGSSSWTREEDKAFENSLANYPEDLADRWEKIASDVPGKTIEEIKHHYELLIDDINMIESGRVSLPPYSCSSSDDSPKPDGEESSGKRGSHLGSFSSESNHGGKGSRSDQERRKGIAWTEDEHRLFLLGLDKYGKGDWRSISRNFVVTRTPTQVASHAQKYFIRLSSMNKDRRRSSIHDITSIGNGDESASQLPITGQSNGSGTGGVSSIKPSKQSPQPPPGTPGISIYNGQTIGQPVTRPVISAVGTPVNLAPPHLQYRVGALMTGTVVAGAPMNMAPVTYSMPHTTAESNRWRLGFTSSSWKNSTGLTVVKHSSHWQCQDFHCLENINRSLTTSSRQNKRKVNVLAVTNSVREHEAVKGKLSLGAIILQFGRMQKVFLYLFGVYEKERIIKASHCYLSTTAGPIAGILFISTEKVAFCSERMIKLSSSDGGSVRVHYKVAIPLAKIETVNENKNMKRPSQKFMQIVTVDKFDFWFMGYLNYQKSFKCLLQVINQA